MVVGRFTSVSREWSHVRRQRSSIRSVSEAGALGVVAMIVLAGCPAQDPGVSSGPSSSSSTSSSSTSSTRAESEDGPGSEGPEREGGEAAVTGGSFVAPEGAVELGTSLRFEVDEDGTQISGLVAEVLETCDGESTSRTTTIGPDLTWDIVDGSFSGRLKDVVDGISYYTTLEGRFTSATTAEGIVRQESVVAGSVCDTYELDFTAVAA